jgi:hypothetical protein
VKFEIYKLGKNVLPALTVIAVIDPAEKRLSRK